MGEPAAEGPYNVLLISSDHHRGDALGILDHPLARTPHLDKLAQQGILFRRAYSECPVCIPARMTVMTGRRPGRDPASTGFDYYQERSRMPAVETLPAAFARAGYQTQAVGKMHFFPQRRRYGFHDMVIEEEGRVLPGLYLDDYEMWLQGEGFAGEYHAHGVTNNEAGARVWHLPERAHPTNWTARECCRWLYRRDPEAPFFLWMSFSAPHPPYTPPAAWWELFRDASVPAPRSGEWSSGKRLPAELYRTMLAGNYDRCTGQAYAQVARAYHALVAQIDAQISLVLGMLREMNLLDRTIVLYLADHGDMLGDFGTFGKRCFYEGSANVPFILVLPPDHPQHLAGRTVLHPVGLQDVMPTLLDAAGFPAPAGLTGRSVLAGLADPAGARTLLHGTCRRAAASEDAMHMLTDGRMKYIWYNQGDMEHLFDLETDPREEHDLAGGASGRALAREWRARLVATLEREGSPDVDSGRLLARPYPRLPEAELRAVSPFNPRGMHLYGSRRESETSSY